MIKDIWLLYSPAVCPMVYKVILRKNDEFNGLVANGYLIFKLS